MNRINKFWNVIYIDSKGVGRVKEVLKFEFLFLGRWCFYLGIIDGRKYMKLNVMYLFVLYFLFEVLIDFLGRDN